MSAGQDSAFVRAMRKIADYAVAQGMALAEAEDHLRTAMVYAAMRKYPTGQKRLVAESLGIHRNTITRIKKTARA
jgi:transcriptional regulator with PAS, ATPase and Fis domain